MVSERSGEAKIQQDNNLEHMLPKEYFEGMDSGLLYINPRSRASRSLQQKRYQINTAPDIAVRSKTPESPLVLFRRPEAPDIHNEKLFALIRPPAFLNFDDLRYSEDEVKQKISNLQSKT